MMPQLRLPHLHRLPRTFGQIRIFAPLLLIVALAWGLDRAGAFRSAENALTGLRMSLFPREAEGRIVLLGIDDRSLEMVGTWPWPREVHGEILSRLFQLGAAEVFLDVDLSTASNPTSDQMLAEVFDANGGAVILPAFRRLRGMSGEDGGAAVPIDPYRRHSWIASVNVRPDADGIIRTYPWGHTIAGEHVPAAASILAGRFGPVDTGFHLNMALTPESIPQYSAADLLAGSLDLLSIAGRSVVVGAHATELRDDKSVPVHGTINGALLHILAAETLSQDIALVPVRHLPVLLLVSAVAIGLTRSPLKRRPVRLLAGLALLAVAVELSALALQAGAQIVISTPVLHTMLLGIGVAVAAREFRLRRWLLTLARIEMRNRRSVLGRIIADSSDAIVVIDEGGEVIELSAAARKLFAVPDNASRGCGCRDILPEEIARCAFETIEKERSGRETGTGYRDLTLMRDGGPLHLEYAVTASRMTKLERRMSPHATQSVFACITVRDVTDLREQHLQLEFLARFDPLTGALNRSAFEEMLRADLALADHSILVFNLHRFKTVNLTLGRDVGDAILRDVPRRVSVLDARLSPIARLGGDTFCVAFPSVDTAAMRDLAERIRASLTEPFDVDGASARVDCRIGISSGLAGGGTKVDEAELALDSARQKAGGGISVFDPRTDERQERTRRVERALWHAIENGELHLAYQPQVDITSGRMIGAEALVRWTHPDLGNISPGEFIPIAENNGFIEQLGRWVLERACLDATSWPEDITVAVNLSVRQFERVDVVGEVFRVLDRSKLEPRRLQLEITESVFACDQAAVCETLLALKDRGVTCALDDFGTGFSSLGYLATLPLDKLKLDRMFVRNIETDASTGIIVKSMLALAKEFGMSLLCEGIETAEQGEVLKALGCREVQGFYFGRPQPIAEISQALRGQTIATKAA